MSKLTSGVIQNRLAFGSTFSEREQDAMATELLKLRSENASLLEDIKILEDEIKQLKFGVF